MPVHTCPPAQHFYQGQLVDSPCVAAAPEEAFYSVPLLQPYAFFDVVKGQQARGGRGGGTNGSLGNQVRGGKFPK